MTTRGKGASWRLGPSTEDERAEPPRRLRAAPSEEAVEEAAFAALDHRNALAGGGLAQRVAAAQAARFGGRIDNLVVRLRLLPEDQHVGEVAALVVDLPGFAVDDLPDVRVAGSGASLAQQAALAGRKRVVGGRHCRRRRLLAARRAKYGLARLVARRRFLWPLAAGCGRAKVEARRHRQRRTGNHPELVR